MTARTTSRRTGEAEFLAEYDPADFDRPSVTVDVVALTIRAGQLSVLLVKRGAHPFKGSWALPGGFVAMEEDLDDAAGRELAEETGLDRLPAGTHLEQLATYGRPDRDPRTRVITVAYVIFAADLPEPVAGTDAASARWWPVADLGLDLGYGDVEDAPSLAFDHAQIIRDGVERTRSKLEYSTLATAFVPSPFTIPELRRVYEATWAATSEEMDASNFRRKVLAVDDWLVEAEGTADSTGGRPARLYVAGGATRIVPPLERPRE